MDSQLNENPSSEYLDTLLQYYEEEVMGIAYFKSMIDFLDQSEKLELLAEVEVHAAKVLQPLIEKYALQPRDNAVLNAEGSEEARLHRDFNWNQFIDHIMTEYPGYIDDFEKLYAIAPMEDRPFIDTLTQHEIAAIEFAKRELTQRADSATPLTEYISKVSEYIIH